MDIATNSYSTSLSNADLTLDPTQSTQVPPRKSKHSRLSPKQKNRLPHVESIDPEALIKIPHLAVNEAINHIKQPAKDFGHKDVNTPRVMSDLGGSIFSLLFKTNKAKPLHHPPEYNQHFMSLIEEIEKYMAVIVAMPNNENELHEDMRKHKKFIQESIDELDFLEKYFGILKLSRSAIINFKKLRPVILEVDASGERF